MSTPKAEFCDRLRTLIDARGLSQEKVAEGIGCTQMTISNYLRGRMPKVEQLQKLAELFGVSVNYLLTGVYSSTAEEIGFTANQTTLFSVLCNGMEKQYGRGVRLACHNRPLPEKLTPEILAECVAPDGLSVLHAFRPTQTGAAMDVLLENPDGTLQRVVLHPPVQITTANE